MAAEGSQNSHMCQVLRHDQSIVTHECLARSQDAFFTIGCQRDIADARMAAIERPFRLSVADDEDAWSCHCSSCCRRVVGNRCEGLK